MEELTRQQESAMMMISKPKYHRIGCPARIINAKVLNSLIRKGIVKRGESFYRQVFIHPDHYSKYKK